MKIIFGNNVLTLRNVKQDISHDETLYVSSADVVLNRKKIGTYREDFWSGPPIIDIISNKELLQEIAEKFLKQYPQGVLPLMGAKTYDLTELYKEDEIEGLLSEMVGIHCNIEQTIKKILKSYPIAVIAKDNQRALEQFWKVSNEETMKNFEDKIVVMKAYKDKENFTFEV